MGFSTLRSSRTRILVVASIASLVAFANCTSDSDEPPTLTIDASVPSIDATSPKNDAAQPDAADDVSATPDVSTEDANGDDSAADAGIDADDAADTGPADAYIPPDAPLPDGGVTAIDPIVDNDNSVVNVPQGPMIPPFAAGCADGQREGLIDHFLFPNMAGCLGVWDGALDLRLPKTLPDAGLDAGDAGDAAPTNGPCGDDLGLCRVPADICADGWHICGASGSVPEVAALGPDNCEDAGAARYVTAISHCQTQSGCEYDAGGVYSCFPTGWCSEAVCCGSRCPNFGACTGGVWAARTHIAQGTDQGCGFITARRAGGVLCCKD